MQELTREQRMDAYAAAKQYFDLKAKQRDQLDASPCYMAILVAVHQCRLDAARDLLVAEGIIQ